MLIFSCVDLSMYHLTSPTSPSITSPYHRPTPPRPPPLTALLGRGWTSSLPLHTHSSSSMGSTSSAGPHEGVSGSKTSCSCQACSVFVFEGTWHAGSLMLVHSCWFTHAPLYGKCTTCPLEYGAHVPLPVTLHIASTDTNQRFFVALKRVSTTNNKNISGV